MPRKGKKSMLQTLGIVKRGNSKTEKLFRAILESLSVDDFENVSYQLPHEYVKKMWDTYKQINQLDDSKSQNNNSLNGAIFEAIIFTLLYREDILPFYTQAKVAFVPNIVYDAILYNQEAPICLSCKTSLRERYKQADLEAIALKYVHRKSKTYLLSIDRKESEGVNDKILSGDVIGIDKVYLADDPQMDDLIAILKKSTYRKSIEVSVVEGNLIEKQQK